MRRQHWREADCFVLEHYDPSGDPELNLEAAEQFASALAERLSELCEAPSDRIEVRRMAVPTQHDNSVCGLTALCYAKAIVDGLCASDSRARDGKAAVAAVGWGEVEALRRASRAAFTLPTISPHEISFLPSR